MPIDPSQGNKGRPKSYSWHQDDTVDATQILQASLAAWCDMEDDHRTAARQTFYAGLFKCCADYLVHRMVGEDAPKESPMAVDQRQRSMLTLLKQGLSTLPDE